MIKLFISLFVLQRGTLKARFLLKATVLRLRGGKRPCNLWRLLSLILKIPSSRNFWDYVTHLQVFLGGEGLAILISISTNHSYRKTGGEEREKKRKNESDKGEFLSFSPQFSFPFPTFFCLDYALLMNLYWAAISRPVSRGWQLNGGTYYCVLLSYSTFLCSDCIN